MRHRRRRRARVSFARLQAPAEDGEWLAHPDPGAWRDLLDRNRSLFQSSDARVGGLRLAAWRAIVREDVAAACRSRVAFSEAPLIVSGHQPELFHPGVWIKNFAAVGFAKSVDGIPLHIVADTDLVKRTTAAVPAGTVDSPLVAHLHFDEWTGEEPFEDRPVRDEAVFRRFGEEAADCLAALPFTTRFSRYWEYARDHSKSNGEPTTLAHRFSAARKRLEQDWLADGSETTLGQCCRPPRRGFMTLAADVISRAAEYCDVYNQELWAFRKAHKVRSANHPAPELEDDEYGVEVPFWAWKPGGRRQRVFVKRGVDRVCLSANGAPIVEASTGSNDDVERLINALLGVADWKIRPRALMTTTFLRLGLADLFIHGLGGAKYDEWNDAVIRRFWKVEPPAYVMLTATRRLPFATPAVSPLQRLRDLKRLRRGLEWNPERYLDDSILERSPLCDWVEEKFALIEAKPGTTKERKARFRRLREINGKLREFVGPRIGETDGEITTTQAAADAAALMGSREFFFGFHEPQSLTALFQAWRDWRTPPVARGKAAESSL
jgi:hypothetical protein